MPKYKVRIMATYEIQAHDESAAQVIGHLMAGPRDKLPEQKIAKAKVVETELVEAVLIDPKVSK